MNLILAIFIGGGLGALCRHYAVIATMRVAGDTFPYGTLAVNILGCFAIGLVMEGAALKWNMPQEARALLVTGFLGGFTTFSAFSLDFFKLTQTGQMFAAFGYAGASVLLSLAAVFGGVILIRGVMG